MVLFRPATIPDLSRLLYERTEPAKRYRAHEDDILGILALSHVVQGSGEIGELARMVAVRSDGSRQPPPYFT